METSSMRICLPVSLKRRDHPYFFDEDPQTKPSIAPTPMPHPEKTGKKEKDTRNQRKGIGDLFPLRMKRRGGDKVPVDRICDARVEQSLSTTKKEMRPFLHQKKKKKPKGKGGAPGASRKREKRKDRARCWGKGREENVLRGGPLLRKDKRGFAGRGGKPNILEKGGCSEIIFVKENRERVQGGKGKETKGEK